MNGGKKVWCRCRAEDKIEQRLYVSEVIGFAIKGNMAKTKCQRFVERFGKAHKNQSGGLGITEKFLWRKWSNILNQNGRSFLAQSAGGFQADLRHSREPPCIANEHYLFLEKSGTLLVGMTDEAGPLGRQDFPERGSDSGGSTIPLYGKKTNNMSS